MNCRQASLGPGWSVVSDKVLVVSLWIKGGLTPRPLGLEASSCVSESTSAPAGAAVCSVLGGVSVTSAPKG